MSTKIKTNTLLIIANEAWNVFKFRKDLISYCLSKGIKVFCLAKFDGYEDRISQHPNFKILNIPVDSRGKSPISELALIIRLYINILKINPDVTMLFTIKPCIYGGVLCRLLKKSYISTITGLGSSFIEGGFKRLLIENLLKKSFGKKGHFIVQNQYDYEEITQLRKNIELQVTMIPGSGINTDEFEIQEYPKNSDFIFLMIARIIKDKGIFEYVEAARRIKKESSKKIVFNLAGAFPSTGDNDISIKQIKTWEDEGVINYLGHLNDVKDQLKKCDCFVLPSYREGTSRAILEASLIGRPTITTDVPGCNNIVLDNRSGFLCKPKSVESLVKSMIKIQSLHKNDRQIMGINAHTFVAENFSNEIVIERYFDLICNP